MTLDFCKFKRTASIQGNKDRMKRLEEEKAKIEEEYERLKMMDKESR